MSGRWLLAQRPFMVRDLVRDYCTVFRLLSEQRIRFDLDGTVSYSALRDLLGGPLQKGVFWRLKDTAHHLFRNAPGTGSPREENIVLWQYAASPLPEGMSVQSPVEALLDWCVGYAFHECSKLKEDAFQRQHYAGRLAQLGRHAAVAEELYAPLAALGRQTAESLDRELARIMHVLSHGLTLMVRYLTHESANGHLARWLACKEELVRSVFGPLFPVLLEALYPGRPQRLYLLAAEDFMASGRSGGALALLQQAEERGLLDAEGKHLLQQIRRQALQNDAQPLCVDCARVNGWQEPPCLKHSGAG